MSCKNLTRSIPFKQLFLAACLVSLSSACTIADEGKRKEEIHKKDGKQKQAFKISPPKATDIPSRNNYIPLSKTDTSTEQWETFFGDSIIVRNIASAGFYTYTPSPEKSKGKSVVILPGGGYQFVSMGNEGFPVAERLRDEGYSVFLLKYRVKNSPRKGSEFLKAAAPGFMSLGKTRLSYYKPALDDLISGLQFLDKECPRLGCDSSKISLIGFSAGARTIMGAIEGSTEISKLESIALMYPPTIDTFNTQIKTPLFVAIAADDPLFKQGQFNLLSDWLSHSADLEFHLYSGGGHGFGMNESDTTSQVWIDNYLNWLSLHVSKKSK